MNLNFSNMNNFKRFERLAKALNLTVIETTSDGNGYPRNVNWGLIGFESFNQAESFAEKHNLDVCLFWRRNGWRNYCVEPAGKDDICVYNRAEYAGESNDHSIYRKSDIDGPFKDWLEDAIECNDERDIEFCREMIAELEQLNDGEVLVYDGANDSYTVEDEYAMSWTYDDKSFVIGVK